MKRTVYTQEQRKEMKDLYLAGNAIKTIATTMQSDKGTIRKELQTMLTLRSPGEAHRLAMGIKFVRSDAFDILTPEALYWIGFLYADGSIEKLFPVIALALAEVDKGHLEKFNQFLGGCLNVKDVTPKKADRNLKGQVTFGGKMFRVKVADRQLYDRLKHLGFTNNKTHTIVPHDLLKMSRDTWRGIIDGDGWITTGKSKGDNKKEDAKVYYYPRIGLCGNEATIREFLNFIKLSGIECKSTIKKAPKENGLYSMDATGEPAMKIMNLLYKDSSVYLDRKYQKYLDFININ